MAVYLLHLDQPLDQGPDPRTGKPRAAAHYIGFAAHLDQRLAHHAAGTGANMLRVARERGITWRLARQWPDADRKFERRLKNTRTARRYCPICMGEAVREYEPPCGCVTPDQHCPACDTAARRSCKEATGA